MELPTLEGTPGRTGPVKMAKIHISDDEADIRHLLSYTLTDAGHDVTASKDGRDAIDAMVMDPPQVLVLDLMMPEMDGLAVLREMQDYQILDSTKILVLTAKGSEYDRHLAFDMGADEFLTKPFEPEEIVTTVETMLASSKEELRVHRDKERDTAHLLSQLESILDDVETGSPPSGESTVG
jgi:DNA-binding response OmpR family regulator